MMSPAGWEHGRIGTRLAAMLFEFVERHHLGAVNAIETGYVIETNPDTVLAPDVAFVSQAQIDAQESTPGFWRGAPDLVVQVVSPSDSFVQVERKVSQWIEAGCRLAWVVNPGQQTVQVYSSETPAQITFLGISDSLSGGDILPGFSLPVDSIFA